MMAIAEPYLPDSYFFLHEDKEHVLSICLQANIDYLLNTALEGQSINRELLAKVLAFANRFAPEERPVDWDHLISRREAGQLQCYCCETVRGANKHLDHLFGEPFTYVGYPSETSNGHLLYSDYNLAISSSCKDKEAAFRFVASMLTNEKQYNFRVRSFNLNGFANFPLLKSALEEKMEYEMHEDRGVHWPIYGRTMSHGPYTEADVQAVWDIIGNTDAVWSFDTQVFDIISEEAGKYFDGDKSVMETIDIIENRLRLYLLERAE
jgi:ABC-type glycerol-3-phosphate transport system substrate-binding protein